MARVSIDVPTMNRSHWTGCGLAGLCAVALLVACETPGGESANPSLVFAQKRGLEIYERDRAAWRATDAALAAGLQQTKARGWITKRADQGWLVRFVAPCGDTACSVMDVRLDANSADATLLQEPERLAPEEQTAWRARQIAISRELPTCGQKYNTVVIPPASAGDDWTVYLLAATTDPSQIVLLGHHRVTVSGDGRKVLSFEGLSQSCLLMEKQADAVAMTVTHVLGPYPIETHVFTSLSYRQPVFVSTQNGVYQVDGATISKVK